jgi:hypothetical protein
VEYLKKTKSQAAPLSLFLHKDEYKHAFKVVLSNFLSSVSDPDSIRSVDPYLDPDSESGSGNQKGKNDYKSRKIEKFAGVKIRTLRRHRLLWASSQ